MLSVLIPVYNYNALPLAKEIVNQFKKEGVDFEMLCYDDGSTLYEKENNEIDSFSNVIFKKSSTNIGRTATRQKLARDASYDWLLFVDADMIPKSDQFIKNYLLCMQEPDEREVIFGGYAYKNLNQPKRLLRYRYGKKREEIPARRRAENPYKNVLSGNMFIKKSLFLKANILLQNWYGLDPLFSAQLQDLMVEPFHIDNEVYHNGLETNSTFLEKSKEGSKTIGWLHHNNHITNNQSQLICAYEWLRKWKLLGTFKTLSNCALKPTERLLSSGRGPLFLFDFYRLYWFIKKYNK
jgi:glycosyltransferase involved in cell wall biosynthesis